MLYINVKKKEKKKNYPLFFLYISQHKVNMTDYPIRYIMLQKRKMHYHNDCTKDTKKIFKKCRFRRKNVKLRYACSLISYIDTS